MRERLEQAAHTLGRQADPRIAHCESELDLAAGKRLRRHGEHDLALVRELDRVGEQIQYDLPQARDVAYDGGRNLAFEHVGRVQILFHRPRGHEIERRFDTFAQIEGLRLDVHAAGFDLGEVQHVVDDSEQRIARFADRAHIVALLDVELGIEQEPAHADDRVHRRAYLVAHGCEERAFRLVGGFGQRARLLGLFEQASVLDRDHRLVGEGPKQRLLLFAKRPRRLAKDADRTYATTFP